MSTIHDKEFGTITIRRSVKARSLSVRVAPDGTLRVSAPVYAPVIVMRQFINGARGQLRSLLDAHHRTTIVFTDGMQVGKSHSLTVRPSSSVTTVERHKQQIVVQLFHGDTLTDAHVTSKIRTVVIQALRLEAKSYLPKRLAYLAERTGFTYQTVRFSHAGGRWGSCSTSGTISLNIALMKLPFELIDYVLIHELVHTVEMNHSDQFWLLVEEFDPAFREHRKKLKLETPAI